MDFQLRFKEDDKENVWQFTKIYELESSLLESLRYWNGFHNEQPITFTITKVPSDTETLGISVDETIKSEDIFGQS